MKSPRKVSLFVGFCLLMMSFGGNASAADRPATPGKGEKINVDKLKEKYWAKGEESELRVVQNRRYSKEYKFEFGLFGGTAASDPFLSTRMVGGSLGFYFTEYFNVDLIGWKSFASFSSATDSLIQQHSINPDTNKPDYFIGGQLKLSPVYGKISLIGKLIIYFDLHAFVGAGQFKTETGTFFTPFFGLGQQFYLNDWSSLRLDYRMMFYSEDVIIRSTGLPRGTSRSLTTEAITLGVTFFLGPI